MQQKKLTFEEIYNQYGNRILNLSYRFVSDEFVAKDLTQDIFIKVYKNLKTFEQKSHIYTWLYRIAVNHIYNYLKKEKRNRFFSLLDKNVGELLHQNENADFFFSGKIQSEPDKILEQSEREKIVRDSINSLPAKYRIPLMLNRYDEMSYKEIASTLKLSLSAVETRIHRAKKELVKILTPYMKLI